MSNRCEHCGVSAIVALLASYCVCVVIPAQTYVAVSECFRYSIFDLLLSYGECAVIGFSALFILLSAFSFLTGRYYAHVIVLAILLACLLEVGLLSAGLPPLNGDISLYCGKMRRWIDTGILLSIVVMAVVFSRVFERHILLSALALFVFASSSLLDIRQQRGLNVVASDVREVGDMKIVSRWDVVQSGRYSPTNNVLVLIVDSVTCEVVSDLFRSDEDLAARFPGFSIYEKNIGMHPDSATGMAGMMTGTYLEPPVDKASFVRRQFSNEAAAAHYSEKGFPVYVNVAASSLGLTNRLSVRGGEEEQGEESPIAKDVRMEDAFPWSVSEIVKFRMIPYALKRKYLKHLLLEWERDGFRGDIIHTDRGLWPYLSKQPIDASLVMTFHVNHSPGGHAPLHFDECGNWTQIVPPTYENYRKQCLYVFRQLADLMDAYRCRGIYDNSTIIIAADHGGIRAPASETACTLPRGAIPALMVKPRHCRTPLRMSSIPTSHSRICSLIVRLCDEELTTAQIDDHLVQEKRLYREVSEELVKDWWVDVTNGVTYQERTFHRAASDMRALTLGEWYEFSELGIGRVPDYQGVTSVGPKKTGHVRLRAPALGNVAFRIELRLLVGQGDEASVDGFSRVSIGKNEYRIEKVLPLQEVNLISSCGPDGEWIDISIDSSEASFFLTLKNLRVTQIAPNDDCGRVTKLLP